MKNEASREKLKKLLGELPDRGDIRVLSSITKEDKSIIVEALVLDLNGLEPVPAYFIKPAEASGEKLPVVVFNHSHGGFYDVGKEELLQGAPYLQAPSYAQALTEMGYAVLCIDAWGFGERHTRTESDIFKEMLWKGQVMWGMMVYDSIRAVDYLVSRQDVDSSRIATLGMSMGGTMAWWLAALDPRVKVCVDLCSLTDFQSLIESNGLSHHGIYYYVPGLLKHFTTSDIQALICPRPHLALAGSLDPLTPAKGLGIIDDRMRHLYDAMDAQEAWKLFREDVAHEETLNMRIQALAFLKKFL
jgi:pimeloyl-ACP methyl ester carboxylesterase